MRLHRLGRPLQELGLSHAHITAPEQHCTVLMTDPIHVGLVSRSIGEIHHGAPRVVSRDDLIIAPELAHLVLVVLGHCVVLILLEILLRVQMRYWIRLQRVVDITRRRASCSLSLIYRGNRLILLNELRSLITLLHFY